MCVKPSKHHEQQVEKTLSLTDAVVVSEEAHGGSNPPQLIAVVQYDRGEQVSEWELASQLIREKEWSG